MSEVRIDPIFGNVTIVARERAARPHRVRIADEIEVSGPCPLCPGNEALAPREIARIGQGNLWQSRVFSSRYPAVGLEAEPTLTDLNQTKGYEKPEQGFGVHELIVESPNHTIPFWMLDAEPVRDFLGLIQKRIHDLYQDRRLLSMHVYKNHRAGAGGSLEHPHFQLIGLPFVPKPLLKLMSDPDCAVCRLLKAEPRPGKDKRDAGQATRFLAETSHFVAFTDYAPTYPYQFSIYPKRHGAGFEEAKPEELEDLAEMCSLVVPRLTRLLGDFALNLVLYTQPNPEGFARPKGLHPWKNTMHWMIRVFPRLQRLSGFELSTGISIIQVAPEDAARAFREKGV